MDVELDGLNIELFDTGGIGIVDRQDLSDEIHEQIEVAIRAAALVLFVVDARVGLQNLDRQVANQLRTLGVPVILIANKCEAENAEAQIPDFFALGYGEPLALSAQHGLGIETLIDRIRESPEMTNEAPPEDASLKIAVVGRRNAGKSTFINAALDEERMIASEVAGTTRDAVDIRFEKDGKAFTIIDTAGLHKRSKLKDEIDYYAQIRAIEAIRRADVVILLLDAEEGVAQIDKKVGKAIIDQHKVCVIGLNKWDLVKGKTTPEEYSDFLLEYLPGLHYAPLIALTAKSGKKVIETLSLAQNLAKQAEQRVGTGELNRALEEIRKERIPRLKGGKEPKIFYGTQVATLPPTLTLFVNQPKFFSENYRRTIENRLRKLLPFPELPVKVLYRRRSEGQQK